MAAWALGSKSAFRPAFVAPVRFPCTTAGRGGQGGVATSRLEVLNLGVAGELAKMLVSELFPKILISWVWVPPGTGVSESSVVIFPCSWD